MFLFFFNPSRFLFETVLNFHLFQSRTTNEYELESLTTDGKKIVSCIVQDSPPPEYHAVVTKICDTTDDEDDDSHLPDYYDDVVKKVEI